MSKKQDDAQLLRSYEIVQARLAATQADAERAVAEMRRQRGRAVRALDDLDKLLKIEAGLWALLKLPPREPPRTDWRLRDAVNGH